MLFIFFRTYPSPITYLEISMQCATHILAILTEAYPKAMPLRRIALNVYNITNTLFDPQDRDHIYEMVAEWLRTESQTSRGAVMKAETKGWYKLNDRSPEAQQLLLEFQPREEDEWMK